MMSERQARERLIDALLPVIATLPVLADVLRDHGLEENGAKLDLMKEECQAAVASVRKELPP